MTWLRPYLRTWYNAYPDSVAPVRQIAHYMKPLVQAHPEARIIGELAAYLAKTPPQFVSLHRFAMAFGAWNRPEPQIRRPHSQTADEADRNAGILP